MSERKPSAFIGDILKCIQHIEKYSSDISFDEFSSNFMIVEACLYNIQVIGEAVSRIPDEIKQNEQEIPLGIDKRNAEQVNPRLYWNRSFTCLECY